ncbi:AAA family ATPase [Brevibacterium aurantiacum]|uniref:AAA family ATPase n=1 Tax=Brevibacterium aurantiacum TaxID=273384 RepID=UPI001F4977E3|nr:zeta toxin family protein [Brevibacterium aurantiacum]
MPVLHLLAGPNGAGKSSYVHDVLAPVTHLPFINADVIAAQRWPDTQLEHAYEAARIAERLRREFIAEKRSFISETVFSHPSKVQLVTDAADAGFLVTLHIVMVPVDLTVQRVRERVRRGGTQCRSTRSGRDMSVCGNMSRRRSERLIRRTCTTTAALADRSTCAPALNSEHWWARRTGRPGSLTR